jgi:hypothetical protein
MHNGLKSWGGDANMKEEKISWGKGGGKGGGVEAERGNFPFVLFC